MTLASGTYASGPEILHPRVRGAAETLAVQVAGGDELVNRIDEVV
jgi:hypothetical protein